MATQGSFKTSAYDSRYLEFAWSRTDYSIANNTSTISWTLTARGRGQYSKYDAGNFKVIIDGEQVYFSSTRITTTDGLLIASGTKTISHNVDGTRSFSASAEAGIYYFEVNCTGSGSFTLDSIPRYATLTSAPNFNDEENPTIHYSNPLGTNVGLYACISLTGSADDIKYRQISNTATSYTFVLTDSEREVLRNATLSNSNSRTVMFILRTTISGTGYNSPLTKTFTVINAEPVIAPAVVDMNEQTIALTGDYNTLIKGYSTAACSINAEAQKGATITSYQVVNGAQTSNQNVVAFQNVENANFTFSATDNRGNTTTETITKPMINYFKPTCAQEADIALLGETEAKITLKITGDFFNGSFGAVDNSPAVQFRLKMNNEDFSEWNYVGDLFWETYTDGNTYSVEGSISGLPYDGTYIIQSRVFDDLATAETTTYTLKLIPVFDWSKDNFNFNVPLKIQNNQLADFVIDTYTEPMGTNGTWYITKWASGKAECYGTRNFGKSSINIPWGSLFESAVYSQDLPEYLFAYPPECVQITLGDFEAGVWLERGITPPSVSDTGEFCFVRPTALITAKSDVSFYVVGQWKD